MPQKMVRCGSGVIPCAIPQAVRLVLLRSEIELLVEAWGGQAVIEMFLA